MTATLIQGGRIIDPAQGLDAVGDILLQDGVVAWLSASGGPNPLPSGQYEVVDARGLVASPGFIDLHCHLREPGFEGKETIATGTLAAAAGGFTTVCCMANTNPVIDERAVVELVLRIAAERGAVRVLPFGAVSKGLAGAQLAQMNEMAAAGAVGFSDDGQPVWDPSLMRHALEYSLALGLPIIDHCQDPSLTKGASMHEGLVSARLGLKGWPAAGEEIMIARDIELARLTGARVHIAHISTAGGVDLVRRAKDAGLPVTAEVTPHHLTLTDERVLGCGYGLRGLSLTDGCSPVPYDTRAKVAPPLRTEADARALVEGLRDGTIDCIATDHAPHAQEDKLCEFDQAANGISGIETALGALLSLVQRGDLDLPVLIERMTAAPARILGATPASLTTPVAPAVPTARATPTAHGELVEPAQPPTLRQAQGERASRGRSHLVPDGLGSLAVGASGGPNAHRSRPGVVGEPECVSLQGQEHTAGGRLAQRQRGRHLRRRRPRTKCGGVKA